MSATRFTLRARLLCSFAIIAALMLAIGVYALTSLVEENTRAHQLAAAFAPLAAAARQARAAATASQATYTTTMLVVIILLIVAFATAAGTAVLFTRRVVSGVRQVARGAHAIAGGELDQRIELEGNDELTDMTREFEAMIAYLAQMARAAERIAAGDLSAGVAPKSERDQLGNAFARMSTSLRAMIGEISARSGSLSAASSQMAATSEQTGRAIQEISSAVNNVAAGAEQQARSVADAQHVSDELAQAAQRSADTADETAAVAQEARTVARAGVEAAEQASAAIISVRDSSVETTDAIKALGRKSDEIGGIVATIAGIASQTNLLALNAAIEAARAGEHGRGFAVVAEEVRHLAEESRRAAASIGELIGEIQAETQRTVQIVESGAAQTAGGVERVERAREAFVRIGASVDEVSTDVQRIAGSIREIAVAGEQMRVTMSAVAEVAEASSASTEQVSASTEQSSASTQQIAASAQELASTADTLEKLVGQFVLQ